MWAKPSLDCRCSMCIEVLRYWLWGRCNLYRSLNVDVNVNVNVHVHVDMNMNANAHFDVLGLTVACRCMPWNGVCFDLLQGIHVVGPTCNMLMRDAIGYTAWSTPGSKYMTVWAGHMNQKRPDWDGDPPVSNIYIQIYIYKILLWCLVLGQEFLVSAEV